MIPLFCILQIIDFKGLNLHDFNTHQYLVHVMELRVVFLIDECKVVLEWLEQNY